MKIYFQITILVALLDYTSVYVYKRKCMCKKVYVVNFGKNKSSFFVTSSLNGILLKMSPIEILLYHKYMPNEVHPKSYRASITRNAATVLILEFIDR